ncbi:flagellar basal body protein [Allorhizobium sp. BGMRC 0089]|uniref:flagellar basal body rod protein FlgC n=1 Tax=Allorhizobium sonneratiae TaxID=2934936 RepID=UPI002033A3D7|nr:flagellar basal body protein [Allorhizobium sonneratiae]MCM2292971.1 flagellar basal body protein [Allorhizobium sonneratiae]
MTISGVMNTSLSGMLAQQKRLSTIANNVANMDTPGYRRQQTDFSATAPSGVSTTTSTPNTPAATPDSSNVDPATEMVDLINTKNSFAANAKAFETGADMWGMLMAIKKD